MWPANGLSKAIPDQLPLNLCRVVNDGKKVSDVFLDASASGARGPLEANNQIIDRLALFAKKIERVLEFGVVLAATSIQALTDGP